MTSERYDQPLIPTANQAASTEVVEFGDSDSLNRLKEQRIAVLYESTSEAIIHQLRKSDSTARLLFEGHDGEQVIKKGSINTDSNLASPVAVRFIDTVGRSEATPDLYDQARHLKKDEQLELAVGGGVSLVINKYRQDERSISYKFAIAPTVDQGAAGAAIDAFHGRLAAVNPKYDSAKEEIADALANGEDESAYSTSSFSFKADGVELAAFLSPSLLRLTDIHDAPDIMTRNQRVVTALQALPKHYSGQLQTNGAAYRSQAGLYFNVQGNSLQKVMIGSDQPGVYYCLKPTETEPAAIEDQSFRLGIELSLPEMYNELVEDRNGHHNVAPFIETATAAQLVGAFEAAGLALNDRLNDSLAEVGAIEKRYGHGYAELTRAVAKLVNDKDRSLNTMFNDVDGVDQKIAALASVTDPAAQAVIAMLKDIVSRDATEVHPELTELPSSAARVEIRNGACKDAEIYIAEGTEITTDSNDRPILLKSSYARPTAITLHPTILNGVRLPAGALLAIEADGYVFMRLTGFSFTKPEAAIAFGAQDAANRQNPDYDHRSGIEQYIER